MYQPTTVPSYPCVRAVREPSNGGGNWSEQSSSSSRRSKSKGTEGPAKPEPIPPTEEFQALNMVRNARERGTQCELTLQDIHVVRDVVRSFKWLHVSPCFSTSFCARLRLSMSPRVSPRITKVVNLSTCRSLIPSLQFRVQSPSTSLRHSQTLYDSLCLFSSLLLLPRLSVSMSLKAIPVCPCVPFCFVASRSLSVWEVHAQVTFCVQKL